MTEAKSTLMDFMQAMKEWELKLYPKKRSLLLAGKNVSQLDELAKAELSEIFDRYVLPDESNLQRLHDLNCGDPPAYDPQADAVSTVEAVGSQERFEVAKKSPVEVTYAMTMKKSDGYWRVLRRERRGRAGKWSRVPL